MRRVLLIGGILVGLAVVGAGLVVVNLQRIIDANRDRIVAGIASGFGRRVEVDRITVGLRGGIGVRLEGLRVADDPAFSTEDFLAAAAAHVVVRVWPLFDGKIEVRRVNVEAPRITVVRTKSGFNLDSLGRREAGAASATPSAPGGGGSGGSALPAIAVALVNIRDGVVRFVDRSGAVPVEHTVAPLHVALSDVSQTTPVRVELEATVKDEPPTHVRLAGDVGPVGEPPFATDVPIETHLAVRGPEVVVPDLVASGSVRRDASGRPLATVRLRADRMQAGGVGFTGLEVDASEREGVATLERLAVQVFGGTIEGRGRVDHTAGAPALALETTARGLAVEQILGAAGSGEKVRLSGRLDGQGNVAATLGDTAVLRRTLVASGHATVRDGVIHEVNLADGVLTGVSGMGGILTLVPERVRDRYPDIFATGDTRFQELSADVQIAGGRIRGNPVVVQAHDYTLRGTGTVTFEQHVDATATLAASPQLTADIVGALREASFLTDESGRLAIPFRVVGTLPNVRPKPDEAFVARVARKVFAGEVVDRLLGGDKPGGDKHPKGGSSDLLRGLDKLFGH